VIKTAFSRRQLPSPREEIAGLNSRPDTAIDQFGFAIIGLEVARFVTNR